MNLIGFIYLLCKDRKNSKKISDTEKAVNQLEALTQELQTHSNLFESQNEILVEKNEIFINHLETQKETLNRLIGIQEQNKAIEEQNKAIEEQKLILAEEEKQRKEELEKINAKPRLKIHSFSSKWFENSCSINLINGGEVAKIKKIELVDIEEVRISAQTPHDVAKDQTYKISWRGWGEKSLRWGFKTKITYEDKLGNTYSQIFKFHSNNKYNLDPIIEETEEKK
jgi:hypothetical protein